MYLLIYTGNCGSKTIHGIKFTQTRRTANISDEQSQLFLGADGSQLYDDVMVNEIKKEDIVPEKEDKKENPVTVEGLKRGNSFDTLAKMCEERGLETSGSKTELAERIFEFENKPKE